MNTVLKGTTVLTTIIFRPVLTSKIFECLICKCIQFKETRFVTSSRAENHVTLYNTSIRSNKSNKMLILQVSQLKQTYSYSANVISQKTLLGVLYINKSKPWCTRVWRSALNTAVFFFPVLVSVIPIIAH